MRQLPAVQEAKEIMHEAIDWSVFKWLFEKPRVRATADRANQALDQLERAVKARWSNEVKAEYKKLTANRAENPRRQQRGDEPPQGDDFQVSLRVEKVKQADVAARRARLDAERTFDEAERQLSTDLAREGCKKAIHSWELHEKAIRKAEALMETTETRA
jgi:hypothetical protein